MSPPPAASSAQERYERERFRVEPGRWLLDVLGGHGDGDSGDGYGGGDGDDIVGGHVDGNGDSGDGVDGNSGKLAEPI